MINPIAIFNSQEILNQHKDSMIVATWLVQKAPKTQKYYKRIISELYLFLSNRPLAEMKAEELILFLNIKCKSKSTKAVYKDVLGSLFSFAVKTGHLQKNIVLAIDRIKPENRLYTKVLTREQIEQMILKEPSYRNRLIIELLYMTGIRVEELAKLKLQSFRKIKSGSDLKITMLVEGKGKKFRTLNVPLMTYEKLQIYWDDNSFFPEEFCFISRKKNYGFSKGLTTTQVFRIIKASAQKAGLSCSPSPHWIRHTSATHAIENGAPIHVVQVSLGHESIKTTGKYLDIRPEKSIGNYLKSLRLKT